jgi:hypothetical protein
MLEKKEAIVPFNVTADVSAYTLVEYDSTAHKYTKYSSGSIKGILMENVVANQDPETAKVMFHGVFYSDQFDDSVTLTEDIKADLRSIGIFVEDRVPVTNY